MKLSYPARSLGALAILAGLAAPALAQAPNAAHSMMQLGQRHVNYADVQTAQDVSGPTNPAQDGLPHSSHSMAQSGQRHINAVAYTGQDLASDAKITIETAQEIALKAQPGNVADKELEKEDGGSGLRYSFNIKSGADMHEVGIDAVTGAVLENSVEGKNPD